MGILMTEGGGNWGKKAGKFGEGGTSENTRSTQRDPKPPEVGA